MGLNDQLAIAILELVALLFPFVALLYQAFIPESVRYQVNDDTVAWYVLEPRQLIRIIVVLLVFAAGASLGHFWALESLETILKIAILLLLIALASVMFLTDQLIKINREYHEIEDD